MSKRAFDEVQNEVGQIDNTWSTKRTLVRFEFSNEDTSGMEEGDLDQKINSSLGQIEGQNVVDENGTNTFMDVDSDEMEQDLYTRQASQKNPDEGYNDLYLDTINRAALDFDFEKLCSVTLSNMHVYACLVCGKYFQGKGPQSQSYTHALDANHHVFINMENKKIYVLPEGYEVLNNNLNDIKYVVDPIFTAEQVDVLDAKKQVAWDLNGNAYTPGFVGMNNIKANDYLNVVIQCLAHVTPLRNYFILENLSGKPQLAQRFGILIRKIWNPRAFKAHVSPHELLQEIALRSSRRFTLTEQADPVEFLTWFLNNLHLAIGGSRKKPQSSIIQRVFQGSMKIESQSITARADAGDRLRFEDADIKTEITKFLMLTLDLPAAPLFQDEIERNIIPQVSLISILGKYDGTRAQEHMNHRRRHRLLHPLPPYLIFHVKRFTSSKFITERNPTIVTFNTRSLDMSPYVEPNPAIHPPGEPILYDLIANVTHEGVKIRDDSVEGEAEKKVWHVHLLNKSEDQWLELQDLFVEKTRVETVFMKESYLQIWEKRVVQLWKQSEIKVEKTTLMK